MATTPRPRICPDCREKRVVPIAYGFPDSDVADEVRRGEVVLGGCLIEPENPRWLCRSCGHEFLSLRPLRRPVPFDPEWLPEPSPTRLP